MNKYYVYILILIIIVVIYRYFFSEKNKDTKLIYVPHFIKKTDTSNSDVYNVPFIIYNTWHSHYIPIKMKKNIDYVLENNPEFDYYLYDDEEAREFIKDNYSSDVVDAFDSLIPGAYKADLWRYCILYKKGGVYMDIKLKPIVKLSTLISRNNFYYVDDSPSKKLCDYKRGIYNAFMISYPYNNIFKLCINKIVDNVKNNFYGNNTLAITGPCLMGNILNNYYSNNYDSVISLYLKTDGVIYSNLNEQITDIYDGYRDDQKKVGTTHYSNLWLEKKIYKLLNL